MNKNKIISLFLIYIILTISTVFVYKYFIERIRVTIEIKSEKNAFMQIFYDTGKGHNGKERRDIRINADTNFQTITALLPSNRIKSLRIDPMIEPGTVFIKSIMIEGCNGKNLWSAMDIVKDFRPQMDISKFEVVNDSLRIDSSGNDPQFVSVKPIPYVGMNRVTEISLLANLLMIIILISIAITRIKKTECNAILSSIDKAIKDLKEKIFFRYSIYGMKAILIALFLYLFIMSFLVDTARFVVNSSALLDGGWMYALSRLPELGNYLGREEFFTYGPLANYLSWVIIPGDLHQQYLTHLRYMFAVCVLYILYLLSFIRLFRIHFAYAIIGGTFFLLNPFRFFGPGGYGGINDVTLYGAIAILSVLSYGTFVSQKYPKNNKGTIFFLLLLGVFSAGAFLFKESLGLAGFLSILVLIFIAIYKRNNAFLKYSLISMIFFIITLIGIYIALTGGSENFFKFIKHSYDQIRLYSQVMAIPIRNVWPCIFAWVLIVGLAISFIRFKEMRIPILILVPTLFMAFKGSFVRYDTARLLIFLNVVPLILISIPLGFRHINILKNPLLLLIITAFLSGLLFVDKYYVGKVLVNPKAGMKILNAYLKNGIKDYVNKKMQMSQHNLATISNGVDIKIRDAVKGHKLAVIPWALAIPDALSAKPLFYPSLQFYSGYTEGLDEANLKYFQTFEEKSNVLLEFAAIDGRYPLYDAPRTYEWLLANYKIIESSKNYILLERSLKTTDIICKEPFLVGSGTFINLKDSGLLQDNDGTGNLRFKRLMIKNLVGVKYAVRSLLLKAPYTYINLELSDGNTYKYRIFPDFLQRGLWLSPFIRNQDDIKSWTSGSPQSIPQVIKVSVEENASTLSYINKNPGIYIQDCYLDHRGN